MEKPGARLQRLAIHLARGAQVALRRSKRILHREAEREIAYRMSRGFDNGAGHIQRQTRRRALALPGPDKGERALQARIERRKICQ